MTRILLALLALFALIEPARADDISDAYGGVGRIIVVLSWKDGDEYVGFGSGFAVTPDRIVTNYHVVEAWTRYAESADERLLAVVPARGDEMLEARLVAYDSAKDLALLELQGGTMEPMTLFSGRPDLGRRYTALGFPSNVDFASSRSVDELFDLTVTPRSPIRTGGDISEARPVRGIDAYVHDADIAGGNSGGPLVDLCGRAIGVNSAVAGASASDSASSFAITYRELARFLRRAGVEYEAEVGPCVTSEDRTRICTAQRDELRARTLGECLAGNRESAFEIERELRQRQELTRRGAETAMFVAFALLLFGALAAAGAGFLLLRDRRRAAIAAGIGSLLLVAGSVAVFVTRGNAAALEPADGETRDCQAIADQAAESFESDGCPSDEEEDQAAPDAAPTEPRADE